MVSNEHKPVVSGAEERSDAAQAGDERGGEEKSDDHKPVVGGAEERSDAARRW